MSTLARSATVGFSLSGGKSSPAKSCQSCPSASRPVSRNHCSDLARYTAIMPITNDDFKDGPIGPDPFPGPVTGPVSEPGSAPFGVGNPPPVARPTAPGNVPRVHADTQDSYLPLFSFALCKDS